MAINQHSYTVSFMEHGGEIFIGEIPFHLIKPEDNPIIAKVTFPIFHVNYNITFYQQSYTNIIQDAFSSPIPEYNLAWNTPFITKIQFI